MAEVSITGGSSIENFSNFMTFTVSLSTPELEPVTVFYRTLRDTAKDFDLDNPITGSSNNGSLTFAPGVTSLQVLIEAESDTLDERDENITLELYNLDGNAFFTGDVPLLRATGIILDNDGAGSNLAVFVSDPVLVEGDSGTTNAVFEVRLSQPAPGPFTFNYTTADISAQAGNDYTATSGTLTFAAGQEVATVSVPVVGDMLGEADERFALIVTPPGSPSIGTDGAVGEALILDTDGSPLPEISMEGDVVTENFSDFLRFTVTLSEASLDPITVNYRTLRDTALDFDLDNELTGSSNNGTLTFDPGETSLSIFIEAESDTLDERDENITLELFNPTDNAVFAGNVPLLRSTGIILDNDGAGSNLALFVGDPVLIEGDSGQKAAVFEVRLSQPAPTAFDVTYTTADITALAGSDYVATSGTLSFAPGQEVASVSVSVVGDTLAEADERFALIVTPPNTLSIGTDGAVGEALILDGDATFLPEISIEGDVVTENFSDFLRFNVTLTEPSLDAITVNYRTLRGTAQDFDLDNEVTGSSNNGVLTFLPGQTSASIFIEAETDSIDERDEHITLELFDPSPNASFAGQLPVLRSTGIIRDNNGTGSNLAIIVSDPVLVEGDSGQKEAVFEVRLSQPAPTSFDVTYTTSDLSAKAGEDYTATSGTLTFAPGQEVAAVSVPVLGDMVGEEDELFALIVTPPNTLSIGTDAAVGEALILDTDTSVLPEISVTGDVVTENFSDFLRFVVTLSEPSLEAVTVDFQVVEGDASAADLDNGLTNGTLTFAPGETTGSIFVEAETDSLDERDESIFLRLENPVNAVFPLGREVVHATGFILDNDGPGPNRALAAAPEIVAETGAFFTDYTVEVNMSRPASEELRFLVELVPGTAAIGQDIQILTSNIVFAPGATTAMVGVRVLGDTDTAEGIESLEFSMQPTVGTPFTGSITNGIITILDGPFVDTSVLTGTPGNDLLTGGGEANTITGLAGDDTLRGRGGDDDIEGGPGSDEIAGGAGEDTLDGGDDGDLIRGQGDDDLILGGLGEDTIFAGTGADSVDGGAQDDEVSGQGGNDTILGDGGADTLRGGSGNDSIEGGDQNDQLFGNGNNDTLKGGAGDDTLQGAFGSDDLQGDAGDDILTGGNGADRLDGGTGNDRLNGGGADGVRDVFVFLLGYDEDRINAFDQLGTDRIELDADLWLATEGLLTAQQAVDLFGSLNGTGTILTLDFGGGDVLEVQNGAGINQATLGLDILLV